MSSIPVLASARDLFADYDVLFCDVWGVVHNGQTAYTLGCSALSDFRRAGGTVILVSNAPRPAASVARLLDERNVPRAAWDRIISSGEVARAHVTEARYSGVHHIGPSRDLDLLEVLSAPAVRLENSDALVVTGLIDDFKETGEDYRGRLAPALERKLPFVCANPDLVVDVGGTLLPCAGSIAVVYEDMGGEVYWAGKPYRPAYEMAHRAANELRAMDVDRSRILAIGDAVRTDIAGAGAYGIDSLFIGQGIHRDDIMPDGSFDRGALDRLLSSSEFAPVAAMETLA